MNKQRRWGKRMLTAAVLTLLMVGLTGCGNQQGAESSQPETLTREIALGERAAITVPDGENEKVVGYLTFDEITLTDRRLEGDIEEKRIAAIRYTYENTDIESGMMISSLHQETFKLLDLIHRFLRAVLKSPQKLPVYCLDFVVMRQDAEWPS